MSKKNLAAPSSFERHLVGSANSSDSAQTVITTQSSTKLIATYRRAVLATIRDLRFMVSKQMFYRNSTGVSYKKVTTLSSKISQIHQSPYFPLLNERQRALIELLDFTME